MKLVVIESNKLDKFPSLFGSAIYKNMPLFSYAEHLFFCGMKQMIASYDNGNFDYYKIIEADVDIETFGFIPLINKDSEVRLETPFGGNEVLSYKAASLVVWLFVIEQIATNSCNDIQQRIYRTMQDIHYSYDRAINEAGDKFFSKRDSAAIHRLID